MSLSPGRLLRAPAVQAALLQLLAVVPMLATVFLLARLSAPVPLFVCALLQGAYAAALSWWRQLAWWWRIIQLLFPITLLMTQSLALPPLIYLVAFVFLLALYWSTFRTQVPFYPSGPRAWDEVARLLPHEKALNVIDIGSGLGGLVLNLARRRPESSFSGIELAPLPWLVSCVRARLSRSGARFIRGDYERLDFGAYDVVFAYLSPAAMSALWRKASAEMQVGSMLLSYEFVIIEKTPDDIILATEGGPALYVWHF